MLDGSFVRFVRPADKEVNDKMYSGYRGGRVRGFPVYVTKEKLAVSISRSHEGKVHDFRMPKESPPKFGPWHDTMKNPSTRRESRLRFLHDFGFEGLQRLYPGIIAKGPRKKRPGRGIPERDRAFNLRQARRRLGV